MFLADAKLAQARALVKSDKRQHSLGLPGGHGVAQTVQLHCRLEGPRDADFQASSSPLGITSRRTNRQQAIAKRVVMRMHERLASDWMPAGATDP
jgi:hypothetical protein